jgi:hypothetical protein
VQMQQHCPKPSASSALAAANSNHPIRSHTPASRCRWCCVAILWPHLGSVVVRIAPPHGSRFSHFVLSCHPDRALFATTDLSPLHRPWPSSRGAQRRRISLRLQHYLVPATSEIRLAKGTTQTSVTHPRLPSTAVTRYYLNAPRAPSRNATQTARMAELADAEDSKSSGRKAVGVRLPLRAPNLLQRIRNYDSADVKLEVSSRQECRKPAYYPRTPATSESFRC